MNLKRSSISAILCITTIILSFARLSFSTDKELSQSLSEQLLHKTFTDAEIGAIAYLEGGKLLPGQLVLMRKAPSAWIFGVLNKQIKNDTFEVQGFERSALYKAVKVEALKAVLPFWRYLYQPTQCIQQFEAIVDERLAYYKKHGVPDGHGMVVSPGTRVAFLAIFTGVIVHYSGMCLEAYIN